MPELPEKKINFKILASVMALGGFLTGLGILVSLILSQKDSSGVEVISAEDEQIENITIDVAGAVEKPGVYVLIAGSRIFDAIIAAGGLSVEADRSYIERYYNLAQKAEDGSKVYIPDKSSPAESQAIQAGGPSAQNKPIVENRVSINSSSLRELDTLWGVGEARAAAIISGRPYMRIEELLEKKIIPHNVFEKNKEKLTL